MFPAGPAVNEASIVSRTQTESPLPEQTPLRAAHLLGNPAIAALADDASEERQTSGAASRSDEIHEAAEE